MSKDISVKGLDKYIREIEDIEVIDGDTIRATIDLGFHIKFTRREFRFYGINAYETTRRGNWDDGLTEDEIADHKAKGKKAKELVQALIDEADQVFVESHAMDQGKYGRWLVTVWAYNIDGEAININHRLLDEKLAVENFYD